MGTITKWSRISLGFALLCVWSCLGFEVPPQTQSVPAADAPQLVQRVRVGYNPISVAVTPDGQFVYVANSTSNSISKLATSTLGVVSTIQMDGTPVWLAMTEKSGAVCVTTRDDLKLSVVAVNGNYVQASIELPYTPEKVVAHPNGKLAYVCSGNNNYVMVVDLEKKRLLQNITTNGECLGVAITPDGQTVLVSTRADEYNLSFISTKEQSVVERTQAGSVPVAIVTAASGEYAYVANHDSSDVTVIHIPNHQAARTIPVGQGPMDLALTPSGNYLYVSCDLDSSVVIVDTRTNEVVYRLNLEVVPWGIAFSPDGTRVYVANYKSASSGRAGDLLNPQLNLGTGSGDRVNNNILLVYQTNKYH